MRAFPGQDAERRWLSLLGKAAGHSGFRQGKDRTDGGGDTEPHWVGDKPRERESEDEDPAAVRAE